MALVKTNFEQPKSFEFTKDSLKKANDAIKKYPQGKEQSAVMELLYIAQEQHNNWIPMAAMKVIADMLSMPHMKVYEVATFYTMFNTTPKGQYIIQVCGTTPCKLCGSDSILKACKEKLGIEVGETTVDSKFTLVEVECLGACIDAPVLQINREKYHERLTPETVSEIIDNLINKT